jgi:TRAP-type C4-dicarboxylate transport system substrate-binding protein
LDARPDPSRSKPCRKNKRYTLLIGRARYEKLPGSKPPGAAGHAAPQEQGEQMNLKVLSACAVALAAVPVLASAQEANIRAAMFIPSDRSVFRSTFNRFVEKVNAEGAGLVKIISVVSEEAIPGMQIATAVRNGIIEMAGIPPSYYYNVMPEGLATEVTQIPLAAQRSGGAIDFLRPLFAQKLNSHFLAQYGYGVQFHLFTNKRVSSLEDFKSLRLRTTPSYRAFFNRLGAAQVQTSRGEVYTSLERGVVDGYANVMSEVKPAGWDRVSKYRIDPGFHHTVVHVLINNDFWKKLRPDQQAFLERAGQHLEINLDAAMSASDRAAGEQLVAGGMEVITLPPDTAKQFLAAADESHWDELIKIAPENGRKLRTMMSPK